FDMTLSSGSKPRAQPARSRRLALECLEDRLAPAVLQVVPVGGANGFTSFISLQAALNAAHSGDVILIEPGSSPGSVSCNISNLTVHGDSTSGGAVGRRPSRTLIPTGSSGGYPATVSNLFLNTATIGGGVTGATVSNCILTGK